MKKSLFLSLLLLAGLNSAQAQQGHIADDVFIFYHGGPSNQYRITGRVRSGSPVTILNKGNGGYVQIRTETGKTGWVPPESVKEGASISVRLPKLEQSLAQSQQLTDQQAQEIDQLRAELATLRAENTEYSQERQNFDQQITELNDKIVNMDQSNLMRWLTYGGIVSLGGVILGLIIPLFFPSRNKRNSGW